MAYTTVDNVASEFKNISFSATTSITTDEVTRFIDEADAYIDGRLDNIYVTPVTGVVSLLILQQISTWLVAQRVKDIQALKTGNDTTNQDGSEKRLDKKAMELLEQIIKDELQLPDATAVKSGGGVSSYNARNNIKPIFKRDEQQW